MFVACFIPLQSQILQTPPSSLLCHDSRTCVLLTVYFLPGTECTVNRRWGGGGGLVPTSKKTQRVCCKNKLVDPVKGHNRCSLRFIRHT
jgi:hypothetical protein